MRYEAISVFDYLNQLSVEKRAIIEQLIDTIKKNISSDLELIPLYGMISFVIPLSIYPKGYHVGKSVPLSFISIASQKNMISIYHMGMYAKEELHNWFINQYQEIMQKKPDLGKSCIRFKDIDKIPFELIGELCKKMDYKEYINIYEKMRG